MGNWIWICEGLVIVFLTEMRHTLLSSVKGSREGEAMRELPRKAKELAIHPFSEILLAELKQENAHRSERRVTKSESSSYS